jgi:Spy/CpxP family protein refolding chaperone
MLMIQVSSGNDIPLYADDYVKIYGDPIHTHERFTVTDQMENMFDNQRSYKISRIHTTRKGYIAIVINGYLFDARNIYKSEEKKKNQVFQFDVNYLQM